MKHLLTIDLESWIFSKRINKKKLNTDELRRLDNKYALQALTYLLKVLKEHNQKITFFVVARLEEIYPGIIGKILSEGHEIGWHTYSHSIINNKNILVEELKASEKVLKKYPIKGFQAPNIVFFKEGYKILKEYGFLYSSSIYGNANMIYNFDGIYEIPVSVSRKNYAPKESEIIFPSHLSISNILRFGIPIGSSLFWGLLGEKYYISKLNEAKKSNKVINLFMHEWQLITPQSEEYRKDISILSNPIFHTFFLPYRINISKMFEHIISKFQFQPCINYLRDRIS